MSEPPRHQTHRLSNSASGEGRSPHRLDPSSSDHLERAFEALQIQVEILQIVNGELRSRIDKLTAENEPTPDHADQHGDSEASAPSALEPIDSTGRHTRAGIVLVDTDLRLRRFTPPAARMFDLTVDDIGRPLRDIDHRFEYDSLVEDIQEALDANEEREEQLQDVDGHGYLVRIRPYHFLPEEGLHGAILSFLDLTLRRSTSAESRRDETPYRRLFEDAQEGIVIASPKGEILDANPAACRIFGYTRPELRALNARELHISAAQRRSVTRIIEKEGALRHTELDMCRKDGTVVTCRISSVARHGPRGEIEAYQTFVRDISDRRRLQREILHIQEEERKRFGQDLHDGVGSQLSGLTMMVATLAQRAEREGLNLTEQLWNIKSLLQETNRDVRRISRGLTPLRLEEAGLTSALQRLSNSIGNSDETDAYFEADPEIPGLSEDVAAHLYWMAQEAVSNAQKHAGAGEIGIRLTKEDYCLVLQVTDDGQGIPEDRDEGLGLNTLQYRAEIIGGQLELTSTADAGTTVTCRVPLKPAGEESSP